jgi:hypothetical protein
MIQYLKPSLMGVCSLVLILSSALAEQKPPWTGKIEVQNGINVIINPKEPMYKGETLTLKEEMAIGGAASREPYSLGEVRSLAVDDTGTIFVLDEKDIVIKAFDKLGKYLKSFGQKGQGPGDLNSPSQITFDRTRRLLIVRNGWLGLSIFGRDGTFLKTIITEDIKRSHNAVFDSRGRLFINQIRV